MNNRLPHPPRREANKRPVASAAKAARGFDEAKIAGMNEVDHRQPAGLEAMRETHDEPEIGFDKLRNGCGVLCGGDDRDASARVWRTLRHAGNYTLLRVVRFAFFMIFVRLI